MALETSLIEAALAANAAGGSTESQATAFNRLATAIVNTIKEANIVYTAGLVAPEGGGPVIGSLSTATLV